MVAPANVWPTLSGAGRAAPADTTARIMNAHHDVQKLLGHMSSQAGHRVPSAVISYLKSVEELTADLLKNPWGADWRAEFSQLRQETLEMRKDLNAVRIAAERQVHGPSRTGTSTFASIVRGAPAPAHHLSAHGSNSSAGVTASEVAQDREVTVRLNDQAMANQYRRETPASLTKKTDGIRARTAQSTGSAPLASVKILASRQLRSGDLRFSVRSAKEAEILRTHREWVRGLHKKAEVLLPTWGIVIHDVNVRSLGVNSPRTEELRGVQDAVISKLVAANQADWGKEVEVTRLNWLRTPLGKSGSLVAEFSSPVAANTAIDRGVLWDGNCLTAVLYDRATRVRQCHNCQKWGHIGTTCPINKPTCVYCASEHLSRSCSQKADSTLKEYKCANCGGAHAAWATECPEREKEVEKMKEMGRYRPRYHPVPAYFSINAPSVTLCPSPASSWGTPVASSTSEGSGTESSDSPAKGAAQIADGLSATQSSSGLQSSQWKVVKKKKQGGKKSSKTRSTATAPASIPSSQQLAATESMDIDTTPPSTQPATQTASPALNSEGMNFAPSQSIHTSKRTPKPSKRTTRKALVGSEASVTSIGSRKSRRIVEQVEKATQIVDIEDLEQQLISDNPEPSEFQPSTIGSSALTEITNQSIFNTRRNANPRKRRHTDITDGILTRKDRTFGPTTTDFGYKPSPVHKTRHSTKPTSKTMRL